MTTALFNFYYYQIMDHFFWSISIQAIIKQTECYISLLAPAKEQIPTASKVAWSLKKVIKLTSTCTATISGLTLVEKLMIILFGEKIVQEVKSQ